jgi:hydrogenase maturation protease
MASTLLIGYGNPGRLDDGLGPACAKAVEALGLPGVTVEANYQLNVEDAAQLAEHDVVVFVDASVSAREPFEIETIEPAGRISFTTHSVEPGSLLTMARDLYGEVPRAYMVAIRGYEFNEFEERLSERATENLSAAVRFLAETIGDDLSRDDAAAARAPGPIEGAEP